MTDIRLNEHENELLEKGLKHSISPQTSVSATKRHLLDIENSILKTNIDDQDDIRTLIINGLTIRNKQVFGNNNSSNTSHKVLRNLERKLSEQEAVITKADKGNTVVIISKPDYNPKIDDYLTTNNIEVLQTDPTKQYLININKVISRSTSTLNRQQIFHSKMIKPAAPKITGLPKIHKADVPIRPLINFTSSPSYKIAKYVNRWLTDHIKLDDNHSIKNNLELVDKISGIEIPTGAKFASFDTTNMYTNIPVSDTIKITHDLLLKNKIENVKVMEITELLKTIAQQNYFEHNNAYYTQKEGLPMGSPLSGTLANIYINYIEQTHIMNDRNKYKKNILYWHRYVDDILVLFNGIQRQLSNLHNYINSIHHKIKFTLEIEENKTINFLDLTITNFDNKHEFNIYRKATQTNHTIHNTSNHPTQHKLASYNHMINRLNNIPLNATNYMEELNTIIDIAINNELGVIMTTLRWLPGACGSLGPALLPPAHIAVLWYFWQSYARFVDKRFCSCSCWDTVFKGTYESGIASYKHMYFNATQNTMKMWLLIVLGIISLYECIKYLVNLALLNKIRLSMIVLFLSSIFSHYYAWWAYLNYYNDEYYSQWNHQLFFTLTEIVSTAIVLHLSNSDYEVTSRKALGITGIALLHILAGGFDQFISNVIRGEGYPHQVVRDLGFMIPDVLHLLIPLWLLKKSRRDHFSTTRPFYRDHNLRKDILSMIFIVTTLFVICSFL